MNLFRLKSLVFLILFSPPLPSFPLLFWHSSSHSSPHIPTLLFKYFLKAKTENATRQSFCKQSLRGILKTKETLLFQLISSAIRYGDCHKPTMELADYWLYEKQLVHKLFKVMVLAYVVLYGFLMLAICQKYS